ncbi:conserved Plasmodium protein, unknown function [Plasmodium ovale]|uniref:Metallo-beta-lactamase domain-containing protein n=2 Tax=Plasmodium ovale TaxID=36330 RepID=A0A1A8WJ11_PLAOA|nr:hypothetical protein, conserved [Plasmodium ovale curtisi]SBS92106.1 hypothetical protein, conserved [Plasmodium ovale curtisi]SCP04762.1 conserved Plasmodium protein, unknown function [Plasmodium ovale]
MFTWKKENMADMGLRAEDRSIRQEGTKSRGKNGENGSVGGNGSGSGSENSSCCERERSCGLTENGAKREYSEANTMEGVTRRYSKRKKYIYTFVFFSNKKRGKNEKNSVNVMWIAIILLILYFARNWLRRIYVEDAIDEHSSDRWNSHKKCISFLRTYFSNESIEKDFSFEDEEFIYIPNKKSHNTIHLKNVIGSEITDNNFLSVYSENMKYLRQTSLNYSLNQRTLSTECYVYFRSFLKEAISPHSLTKAIKIEKEYIYPWDVITQDDVEKIIENAKFYGFLFTWFKNHRKAQKVNKDILKKDMPVLSPRFIQRPDIYTHFYKKNNKNEPNFYGIHYTWLGHATGLVTVDGFKILVDPVFKIELLSLKGIARSLINWVNIKIMGGLGERISRSPCNISNLPDDLHAVFVSHNHQDHIMEEDVRILCKLKKFQHVMWYVPEGTASFFLQEGCKAAKIFELSWGDERWISCWISYKQFQCKDGIWKSKNDENKVFKYKIIYAPTLHWSGRKDNHSDINHSLWGSLILKGPKHRFYFSGDTAYLKDDFEEFKKIGKLHGPFHLAALSIGAYEPNNSLKYHHVHPWESVKIWRDIRAETAIGVHWGTFRLSAEEFMQPRDDLEAALLGVGLYTLRNFNLPLEKRKLEIMKKYYIKNDNEEENETDDLEDLKEYFYPASNEDANEYTDSFHSLFSNSLNLFYSDIDKNYVKHMYQQKKLYASTYNRYKRALLLKNSKKLPKCWKKLLLNLSIRFQTIPIGGSLEVISKGDNISMTRSSEYNATLYEHYTFPRWYNSKEKEEAPNHNSYSYEDLMNFHIVN